MSSLVDRYRAIIMSSLVDRYRAIIMSSLVDSRGLMESVTLSEYTRIPERRSC